ncbi:hypothetical protein SUGI_0029650 [Cryptomeria japonica]|nr:hypothetical protein SUGI_0029650 [Cryptomeria japonica]
MTPQALTIFRCLHKEQEHKFGENGKKICEGGKGKKRPAEDENEDELQEFFALVDRIHAIHKLYKQRRMNFPSAGETPTSQIVGGDVIQGKSLWKPSFQWEDFFPLAGRDSTINDCSNNSSTLVVCEMTCVGSDQRLVVSSFDLNVEATTEE